MRAFLLLTATVVATTTGCTIKGLPFLAAPSSLESPVSSTEGAPSGLESLVEAGLITANWTRSNNYFGESPQNYLLYKQQILAHPMTDKAKLPGKWVFPSETLYGGHLTIAVKEDGTLGGELFGLGPVDSSGHRELFKASELISVAVDARRITIKVGPGQGFLTEGTIDGWIGFRDGRDKPEIIGTYTLEDGVVPLICAYSI